MLGASAQRRGVRDAPRVHNLARVVQRADDDRPNAAVAVDPDGGAGGSIVVVATQPIAAGEAISFSYVADSGCYDDGELRPTAERWAEIEAQCGFVCRCAACEP